METIVLLNEARTLTTPEVTFFEPLALRTLIAPISSLRRSSAVGCLATPPTSSTGFSAGAAAAGAAPSAPSFLALGARAGFSAAAATGVSAPAAAGAASFLGAFLGADFSSAMTVNYYLAGAVGLVTPTVRRGP